MKKSLLLIFAFLVASVGIAAAQTLTVTGTVVSESDGQPVVGAYVLVNGTTLGTITNDKGEFGIRNVPASAKEIIVTFLGYSTASAPVQAEPVKVVMKEDSNYLDETIVVAYGVQKKSSFVGAATQLTGEKLEKSQASNLSKSLEGAVAGLQVASSSGTPGSGGTIHIRGFGSMSASTTPLIVVDGTPYEGSLNSIPAQDIESLTVLKDAAANSMYGARGSNGVIIITTKRGAAGKVNITFDAKVGVNSRGVPAYDVLDNPADFYEMTWESIRNAAYYKGIMSYAQANAYASAALVNDFTKYNVYKGVANDQLIDPSTGRLNPAATELKWTDNWTKDVFRPGLRQEYNVAASGGSDKTQGYFSVSYLDDQGYTPNSGFTRISVRGKVDQTIGKHIRAGVNLAYSNTEMSQFNSSESSNYSNIFLSSQSMPPIYPIYLYDLETGERQYDKNGGDLYDWGKTRPAATNANAYGQLMTSHYLTVRDNISSRGYLDIKILKDLKFSANVAFDVFNTKTDQFMSAVGGDAAELNGRGKQQVQRYTAINANQLLSYTPTFGLHNLNVLLGHETKADNSYYLQGSMTNFVDQNVTDFDNALVYQGLYSGSSNYFLQGVFARAEYDYAGRYFASASYRRDGSSRFHPDNRWGSFWALGASWNAKQEAFLQGIDEIDMLKVKASYGTQGNDNLGYTTVYKDLYSIARVDGAASLTKSFRAAPDVTWEKSQNFNIGIESRFLNRFSVNADFFVKHTKDMIYMRPLPPSDGEPSAQLVNDMDMKNTGIEFELSADVIKTRDINWNISLNGTHYKNAITKLPADKPQEGYSTGNYWREVGSSIYEFYLKEWAGVDPETGLPQFNRYYDIEVVENPETGEKVENKVYGPDGKHVEIVNTQSDATYRKTGKSPIPKLYGGLSTSLSLYGFDFSATFAYQLGGYVLDSTYQSFMGSGDVTSNWHKDIFNRWTPENRYTDVPRVQDGDMEASQTSTRFLTSASYVSLRNATLGYTLPKSVLNKLNVQGLRVYLTGDNLWYKSARKGLDVRQSFSGSVGYGYSAIRTVSLGVNVTF